jgi:hypothetical protein
MAKADPRSTSTAWLFQRPTRGWLPWAKGTGERKIEHVWHEARPLHFPKDNATVYFDGSDLVGIQLWGVHGQTWCMKKPPAGWKPRPYDPIEQDRIFKDWINKRRAARNEPLLPYMAG